MSNAATIETPILIDLRTALTDEVIAEALPHLGKCSYASPCIIGAMIPAAYRRTLDCVGGDVGTPAVDELCRDGTIEFPLGQRALAVRLQEAFDNDPLTFTEVVAEVRAALAEQVS